MVEGNLTVDNEPQVFLNGRFIAASQASLAIYDLGIVLGATVTEMTRTFRQHPFRLGDHIARLYRSCRYARIAPPFDQIRMSEVSKRLVENNARLLLPDQELGLIHFLTPGECSIYSGLARLDEEMSPTLCIHTFPLPFDHFAHFFIKGAHVVTPSIRHLPPQCVESKMKHRSRMHQWLADQETRQVDPRAVTLFLDLDGNVTETSGSNFAIVQDAKVIAPTFRNTLPGISLLTAKELCAELGIGFEQRDFRVYDVVTADEVMLLTTPYCMAPVTRINGVSIGCGEVQGPIFQKLIEAWGRRVGVDIIAQVTQGVST